MTNPIIYIIGPTGTGKTSLALKLYKKMPSVLISADSRQVYRGMDIVPGKDHSPNVPIYGLDLADPAASVSVSTWCDAIFPVMTRALGEGKTPIIVGGTGFYVKAILSGIPTINIPVNPPLRHELEGLSLEQLQARLQQADSLRYSSMNHSDQSNPRRLIRAIEVARSTDIVSSSITPKLPPLTNRIFGLRYSTVADQQAAIHARVLARLKNGALTETKMSLNHASPQSLSALGYPCLIAHLKGELSEEEMIDAWVKAELSYVKRQLTFFRKLGGIWYDRTVVTDEEIIYDILQS